MIKFGKFATFILTSLVLFAFVALGFYFGAQNSQQARWHKLFDSPAFAGTPFANLPMDSAARGKSLSLATGMVDPTIEGLFGLDHLTGQLHCWIINPRTGVVAARASISASGVMGITDADADYVLTTGATESYNDNNARSANSLIYVGEGNSGKVAAFTVIYNRQVLTRGNNAEVLIRQVAPLVFTRDPSARRDQ